MRALWDWASSRRGKCFFFFFFYLCASPEKVIDLGGSCPCGNCSSPGEMFLEQRDQIRCLVRVWHLGCLLPGPINTSKWHRAVLVLGESWVLSYPLCHQFGSCLFWAHCCCLQFEVLLAHGLYGACFSASPPLRM